MPELDEVRQLLHTWGDILGQLLTGEMSHQELAATLDRSRRTIRRTLEDFEEFGLVHRDEAAVRLTQLGRQVAMGHCNYIHHLRDTMDSAQLLERLPGTIPIPCTMMDGAQSKIYPESIPDAAFEPIEMSMHDADRVRGISPVARDRYVEVFSEHIFTHNTNVELVLEYGTIEGLDEYYPDAWRAALSQPNCTIWPVKSVPEFGLIIVDKDIAWIGVHREGGDGLMGVIHNDSPAAVSWGTDFWNHHRSQASEPL